jgi:GTP-binding protein
VVGSRADIAAGSTTWDGAVLSAVTGAGVDDLVGKMLEVVAGARAAEPEAEGFVVHRPIPQGIRIERDLDGSLLVVGRQAERAVALSDLTNPEALAFVQERLRRLGVDKALARAGAKEGETVHIGAFAFEYFAD